MLDARDESPSAICATEPLVGGDPFDPAGSVSGTFEMAVNSAAVIRRCEGYGGVPGRTICDIFLAPKGKDPVAAAAVDETERLVSLATGSVQVTVDSELFVLGGSIGRRIEMSDRVRLILRRVLPSPVNIKSSTLGDRASLMGALGMALNQLHAELFGVDAMNREISETDLRSSSANGTAPNYF